VEQLCSVLVNVSTTGSRSYESCEWISTQWLSKWMSESSDVDVSPINNSQLCCRHERYVSRWKSPFLFLASTLHEPWDCKNWSDPFPDQMLYQISVLDIVEDKQTWLYSLMSIYDIVSLPSML